jgi:3-keto-L-gulonate-6-phosphate decarboxylase
MTVIAEKDKSNFCKDFSLNITGGITPKSLSSVKTITIKVITKLPNSEQSYKGKVKTHNYINRQNQSTTGKL